MAAETCWIKDEHGRFMGRRPGCKMTKSGVMQMADKEAAADVPAAKPEKEQTAEQPQTNNGTAEANPPGNIVDAGSYAVAAAITAALLTRSVSGGIAAAIGAFAITGLVRSFFGNIAFDVAMDELTKYAEEKLGTSGETGAMFVPLILAAIQHKFVPKVTPKGMAKTEGAILGKKAEKGAENAVGKKAATAADKAATEEAAKKAAAEAAAAAEKKAAQEAAKRADERGKIYDETADYKNNTKTDTQKKAIKLNVGDVTAEEAKAVKAASNGKVDITGYTTEASQAQIEHSIVGHSVDKAAVSKEKLARGEPDLRRRDFVPEEKRVSKKGTYNEPLTKADYQKIEEYRKQAVKSGNIEYKQAQGALYYSVPQKAAIEDGVKKNAGVIVMRFNVDPVTKKLTFESMWKEGYRKPPKPQI